jgi:hypothetical protein
VPFGEKEVTLSAIVLALREMMGKLSSEEGEIKKAIASAISEGPPWRFYTVSGVALMQLALILLCIAAIQFFLASPVSQVIPTPLHLFPISYTETKTPW